MTSDSTKESTMMIVSTKKMIWAVLGPLRFFG